MSCSRGRIVFWAVLLTTTGLVLGAAQRAASIWSWAVTRTHPVREFEPFVDEEPPLSTKATALPSAVGRQTILPQGAGLGWPTLLGPAHDSTSPETGLDLAWQEAGPYEKWRIAVGTGYAGPVAVDDALILLHRKADREVVECFDPETGQSRWEHSWPATYECPVAYSSGPYSTPVLDEGRVYAVGADGETVCLRLDDGSLLWRRSLHREYCVAIDVWPTAASPLVDGPRLILNLGGDETGAGIVALDKSTGKTLWTCTNDKASCSTPRAATIHGVRHAFVWTAEALLSVDPADGTVRWRIPFAANNREAAHGSAPLVADDIVLVSGYQLGNLCLRVLPDGSYRELWRGNGKLLDSQYGNLLYVGESVCGFSTTRKCLRCLDLMTGELKWQWRSRKFHMGTTIAVDGACLVLSERGYLASLTLDRNGVTVKGMTPGPVLPPPVFSYPALHNGLLYVRNDEQVSCIDLRKSADGAKQSGARSAMSQQAAQP